tara:strand:- start:9531 stop:10016 length:486 start_codon:yes stop_codon:yes gene_type:complete
MVINIIAAVANNGVIGKDGEIPWHISEDLRRFKELTVGHSVVMGRLTYDSIVRSLGKPLSDRVSVVLSRRDDFRSEGNVVVARSIDEALEMAANSFGDTFVAGGKSVYELTINLAAKMELTEIHGDYEGDVCFPEFSRILWKEVERDDRGDYSFVSYARRV